jgi:hypothetical protein
MNIYKAGKSHGSTSHDMGKKPNSTGVKVSNSAGKSSGTDRMGDPKGAPAMGKGK